MSIHREGAQLISLHAHKLHTARCMTTNLMTLPGRSASKCAEVGSASRAWRAAAHTFEKIPDVTGRAACAEMTFVRAATLSMVCLSAYKANLSSRLESPRAGLVKARFEPRLATR